MAFSIVNLHIIKSLIQSSSFIWITRKEETS